MLREARVVLILLDFEAFPIQNQGKVIFARGSGRFFAKSGNFRPDNR
jgi:hypothetical protein